MNKWNNPKPRAPSPPMKAIPQGVGRLPGELGSVTALHWVSLMKARKEHITQCFFWEPASLQWLKSIKTVGKGPSGGREKSPLQHSVCFPLSPSPRKVKLWRSPWQATSLPGLGRRWWGFKGSESFPSPPCLRSPLSVREIKGLFGIWILPGKTSSDKCIVLHFRKGMDFTVREC